MAAEGRPLPATDFSYPAAQSGRRLSGSEIAQPTGATRPVPEVQLPEELTSTEECQVPSESCCSAACRLPQRGMRRPAGTFQALGPAVGLADRSSRPAFRLYCGVAPCDWYMANKGKGSAPDDLARDIAGNVKPRPYSARPIPMHASPAQTTPAATVRRCHCVRSRNTTSDMAVASTIPALV